MKICYVLSRTAFGFLFIVYFSINTVHSTPSTALWTPACCDIQSFGVFHLGIDNYSTIGKKGITAGGQMFPTDFGITVGVLSGEKIKMEVGIDIVEPTDYPLFFNAKIGVPEKDGYPAFNLGIFNVGTEKNMTDYNVLDVIIGKTLPLNIGRIHIGYYTGNSNLFKNSNDITENQGYMIGFDRYVYGNKLILIADYASGNNILGGSSLGLAYYFTDKISLLAGPVWFNDSGINGDTKWTFQLDINLN